MSSAENSRYYRNIYPDFCDDNAKNIINITENKIDEKFKEKLCKKIDDYLLIIEKNSKEWNHRNDNSIYTGNIGVIFLYYFLGTKLNRQELIDKAENLLKKIPKENDSMKKYISFLIGIPGVYITTALIQKATNQDEIKIKTTIEKLNELLNHTISQNVDELLYGKSGYLYSLLYTKKNISNDLIKDKDIKALINKLLINGKKYSSDNNFEAPLMYSWHDKEYLGGAHGLAGILFILLQAREYLNEDDLKNYIEPTIRYLIKTRFPSGNFPSSVDNDRDRLVHWCHGAPSMTMLFTTAHQVFGKDEYLNIAKECGDVIWKRGLLKKGCGLCHGVAGNAYSFLCLYNYTKELKYLYYACKFAEWCFDYEFHQERIPDRPYSLFEGLAGVIYFLADLLNPTSAKFPGYEL
ncbi:glutathione S-transferase LANCL1 [Aphidius gifuensis]|nr:glutathione S-transferase LANCL1 [Aphidius gifuensis]